MPFPGFHQISHSSSAKTGWGETTYLHDNNLLLLYRREGLDVHGNIAYITWILFGPPQYGDSNGHPAYGPMIYQIGDLYSGAKLQEPNAPYLTNLQIPAMSQEDRLEDMERVVGTAVKVIGSGSGSKAMSRLETALQAGLSDEDALLYVNGDEKKMTRAGKRKLKKQQEANSEGVMLNPRLPGESDEEWEERTGRDMGDGAPF